jgi:retinol dehydrogenase-13
MQSSQGIAMVTGAYGAIGKAIARQMALKGYTTILIGRDEAKLKQASGEIIHTTGNKNISFEVVDLSSKSSIRSLAERWKSSLQVLINNAATTPRNRTETPEGIELQFATNVLGYFWMISFFSGFMEIAQDPRIVNVASYWAGGLDLTDPEFKNRRYNNDQAYRQSKQADRMLTVAFAERLRPQGITVNSCHPGDVNSKLSNNLGFGGHESPDMGAATPVWLATDQSISGVSGKYFEQSAEVFCSFSKDKAGIEALFRLCENY